MLQAPLAFSAGNSLLLAGLLAAGLLLLSIAQFVRVPYPILLVLGGLALSFVPGVPQIQLRPEIVLVAVLPPLLYGTAFFTSLRELRANAGPITALAVGLVLTTMIAVAAVAHRRSVSTGRRRSSSARSSLPPTRPPRPRSRSGSACRGG